MLVALAATARSGFQIATKFHEAPLAYLLPGYGGSRVLTDAILTNGSGQVNLLLTALAWLAGATVAAALLFRHNMQTARAHALALPAAASPPWQATDGLSKQVTAPWKKVQMDLPTILPTGCSRASAVPEVPPAGQPPTPGGFIVYVSARPVSQVQLRRAALREPLAGPGRFDEDLQPGAPMRNGRLR